MTKYILLKVESSSEWADGDSDNPAFFALPLTWEMFEILDTYASYARSIPERWFSSIRFYFYWPDVYFLKDDDDGKLEAAYNENKSSDGDKSYENISVITSTLVDFNDLEAEYIDCHQAIVDKDDVSFCCSGKYSGIEFSSDTILLREFKSLLTDLQIKRDENV